MKFKFLKWGAVILVLLGIAFAGYAFLKPDISPQKIKASVLKEISLDETTTITPNLSKNFSTVLLAGTINSYETGKIFTRAQGLIDDVYVEVGDKVKAGQKLASMIAHGAEGEATAMIAEKDAMRQKAKVEYENALKLAIAFQNTAQVNVDTTILREDTNVALFEQNLLVAKATLENTEKLFGQSKKIKEAKLAELDNEIDQFMSQAVIAAAGAFQKVSASIIPNKENIGNNKAISIYHFPQYFGTLDPDTKTNFISAYNAALNKKIEFNKLDATAQRSEILNYLADVDAFFSVTEALLRATVDSVENTEISVSEKLAIVHEEQTDLAMAREKLTGVIQEKLVLEKEEDSAVTVLENNYTQQHAMVLASEQELKLAKAEQFQNIELAQKGKEQTLVEKNADIAKMKAELDLAEAVLNLELAKSGHSVINAPFDGVIAKRLISVGDSVMNNEQAFEMSGVDSFLGKAKSAIVQFGAPENLFNVINEGDVVEVFLPEEEDEIYKAVVTGKSAIVDPDSKVFTLLATFDDEVFFPDNSNVRVRVVTEKDPVWQVPSRSVKKIDGNNYLWILDENKKPEKVQIALLAQDGEFADVRGEAITADSMIVIDPPDSFLDKIKDERKAVKDASGQ